MKYQVYRATRNILPSQISEFYAPANSNYLHGDGMYFAFKKDNAAQLVARSSGFAVLGHFQLEIGSVIYFVNDKYVVDPNSDLGRLQHLLLSIRQEYDGLFKTFGFKVVQDNPEYDLANNELQDQILQETINYNVKKETELQGTEAWLKYQELRQLSQKVFLELDKELSKVDAVITSETMGDASGMISLKKAVPINLLSFDLHCSEAEANYIWQELKVGDVTLQGIMEIPGEYADVVSRLLKQF